MLKLAGEFGIAESELDARIADQIDLHKAALDPHLVETLPVLLKGGNLLHIPTNAGWTSVVTGSGSSTQDPFLLMPWTGATDPSTSLLWALASYGFTSGGASRLWVSWDKKLYIIFNLVRYLSNATGICRLQLKQVNTEGALGAKGIGIRCDNLDLVGESYGTALGEVSLQTLTNNKEYQVVIILYPSSKIEWYVDGVLKGTQSTSANIPSGSAGATSYLVVSSANAGTAADIQIYIIQPKLWQER